MMGVEQTFKIEIEKSVEDIINWFTHNYDKEISGWLVGEYTKDSIKITDLLIPHQEVGGASVDTDGKALIKLRKEYGNKCLKIIGHFHCITGDIPILLSDGSTITAKQLYKSEKKHKLVAYNYKDNFNFITPQSIKKEYSPSILKFNVGDKEIKVTPKHLFMDINGKWKFAKDFKEGDKIYMLKSFKQETPKKFNKELAYLYGSLLSEGCLSVKRINKNGTRYLRGNISNKDLEFLNKNKQIITKHLNYTPQIYTNKKTGVSQLTIGKSKICEYFENKGFIVGRGTKRIPKIIMTSDKGAKESFIKSFISGDGSIEKRGEKNIYKRIYTTYKELASDFCYLLSSLGYKPLLRVMEQNFKNRNHDFMYEVYFQSVKQKVEKRKHDRKYKNVFTCEIKNIEKCKGEEIYSIEIPELHNYVCGFGGFISHNSHNTMGNFWSGTDESFIEQYMDQRDKALFLVSSKSKGHRIRLEIRNPISLSMDELEYETIFDDSLKEELEKVIKEKVTETKVLVVNNLDYAYYKKGDEPLPVTTGSIEDEVDAMVIYDKKNRCVLISYLTYQQYKGLEDLGEHKNRIAGNSWYMMFDVKGKREAKKIMNEAKSYLVEEIQLKREFNLEDKGY